MANDVANSLALCENRRDQLLEGVPSGQRAQVGEDEDVWNM